jgi:hypothetical protein
MVLDGHEDLVDDDLVDLDDEALGDDEAQVSGKITIKSIYLVCKKQIYIYNENIFYL